MTSFYQIGNSSISIVSHFQKLLAHQKWLSTLSYCLVLVLLVCAKPVFAQETLSFTIPQNNEPFNNPVIFNGSDGLTVTIERDNKGVFITSDIHGTGRVITKTHNGLYGDNNEYSSESITEFIEFRFSQPIRFTKINSITSRRIQVEMYNQGEEVYSSTSVYVAGGSGEFTREMLAAVSGQPDEPTFDKVDRIRITPIEDMTSDINVEARGYTFSSIEYESLNEPPTATFDAAATGGAVVGEEITAVYAYADAEGDEESGTTFQWFIDGVAIDGATSASYTPTIDQLGGLLKVEITPSDGNSFGTRIDPVIGGVSCADGFTCETQNVSVCDADTYQVPNGPMVSENGSYETISGTVKTYYKVTFDRVDATPDVFVNAVIAESGSVTYQANTNATGVLFFDNSQDYWVDLNALQDDLNGTSRSIFMWIKTGNVASSEQILFGINDDRNINNNNTITNLFIDNNGNNLETNDGNNNRNASFDVSGEVWNYVGYTYNANTNETVIYVNGIAQFTYTNDQTTAADSRYSLGQEFDKNESNHYNGKMAEVSVWDEALTGAEVRQAMKQKITNAHPKFANLVGYYSVFGACDDDAAILKDHSGKGNDGVMKNGFTQDFKNVESIPGFNAVGWYENLSWKKDGTEVSTSSAFTTNVAAGSYEFIATRNFIKSTDAWTMTVNSNATSPDFLMDETLCEDDAITRTVTDINAINYLDFEEDDEGGIAVNSLTDDLVGTDRSVFMWVKKESNVGNNEVFSLLTFNGPDVEEEISRFSIHSSEKISIWDGDSRLDANTTLDNDTWYHVGYTYNATNFETKLYVNGVLENTGTREMPLGDGYYASLGHSFIDNGKDNFFDGKMAEVTVWDKLLTKEEVTALMAAAPAHNATNLVAAYGTIQSLADNQLRDLTANGNNGVATHSTIFVSDLEETITDYDASNNYSFSWKKEGTEFDTDASANINVEEGTFNYSVVYGAPLFQKTDAFSLSYTNLIPTQPVSQTAGVTGSVTFEVDEIPGASYQWYKRAEGRGLFVEESSVYADQIQGDIDLVYKDTEKQFISELATVGLGGSGPGLNVSGDGGQTWSLLSTANGLASNSITKLAVKDDLVVLLGEFVNTMSISTDGGQTFSAQTEALGNFAVDIDERGYIYVVNRSQINYSVRRSTDQGSNFTLLATVPFAETASAGSFNANAGRIIVNGDNIVFTGNKGGEHSVYISNDDGASFTALNSSNSIFSANDDIEGIVFHEGELFILTDERLYKSEITGSNITSIIERSGLIDIESTEFGLITANGRDVFEIENTDDTFTLKSLLPEELIFNFVDVDGSTVFLTRFNGTEYKSAPGEPLATSSQLTIEDLTIDDNSREYFVVVSKDGCSQTSDDVTLTVLDVPVLTAMTPASGSTDIAIDTEIRLTFSKDINLDSRRSVKLVDGNGNEITDISATRTTLTEVTLTINQNLEYATTYSLLMEEGFAIDVTDGSKAALAVTDPTAFTFTTVCETLILEQPTDQEGFIGQSATFSVPEVAGARYQWFRVEEERLERTYTGQTLSELVSDGQNLYGIDFDGSLLRSTDNGETFNTVLDLKNIAGLNARFTDMTYDRGELWIAVSGGNESILVVSASSDGDTFNVETKSPSSSSVSLNALDIEGDDIITFSSTKVYISNDRGGSWNSIFKAAMPASGVGSTYAPIDVHVDGDVMLFVNRQGLSISNDKGANFQGFRPGDLVLLVNFNSVYSNNGVIYLGHTDGVAYTTDNGQTWNYSSSSGGADLNSISSINSVGNEVFAGNDNSQVWKSTDNGANFTMVDDGDSSEDPDFLLTPHNGSIYSIYTGDVYRVLSNRILVNSSDDGESDAIAGSTSASLTISNLTADLDQSEYLVVVTKGDCEETSNTVTLTVGEAPPEPPVITTLSPADDEIDVARFTTPTITFDKAISKGTGNIEIRKAADNQLLTTIAVNTVLVGVSDKTATLRLGDITFEFGTEYYIIIPEGAFNSTDGGVFGGISDKTEWSFTIIDAPAIEAITPADDATDVDPAINEGGIENAFTLLFNRAMVQGPGGGFGLYKVEGDELVGITANVGGDNSPMKLEDDDRTVKMYFVEPTESLSATNVTPVIALEPATEYYIRTVGDPFDDFSISDNTTWNFTTTTAGPPVEVVSFSPESSATGISTDFNVGGMNFSITFQEPMTLDLSAQGGSAEIYNASTNELLGSNHFPVGSGTFLTDLSTDGLTFNTTFINTQGSGVVELVDGQEYYILITDNHISRASDGAAYIISDPTEWSFTVGEAADPTFTHASFSPINGATEVETDILLNPNFQNVQIDEPLRINFEDPISAGTSGTIGIYKASDDSPVVEYDMATENIGSLQLFGGQISNSFSLSNITIVQNDVFASPTQTVKSGTIYISSDNITLENNTEYYVLIDRGAVVDKEDATIVYEGISDKTVWSFTTEPAAQSSFSDVGLYPTNGQTEVPININELDFNGLFPMAPEGQVFGHVFYFERRVSAGDGGKISLYKSSDNSLVYELNTADEPILSMEGLSSLAADKAYLFYAFEVSFIIINSDVPLETNTEYYWLIDEGVVEDPGTDEVFAGISDPTAWSFTTADIQPLVITGFKPDNNGTEVDIDRYLQFEFDQGIVLGTGNVTVYDQNDQVFEVIDVTATSRVQSETNLRVYPSKFYTPNETYYVLADAGVAVGLNGAAFSGISDKSAWAFTIEDYEEVDADEFFPEPGSSNYDVSTGKEFEVDFDTEVDLSDNAEVSNGNLRVYKASDDALIATIELSDMDFGEEKAEFDVSGLEPGTEYYVLFDDGLFVDLDEPQSFEGISDPTVWRFTTLAVPSTPTLLSTSPSSSATAVSVSANIELTYSENVQAYVYGEGGSTVNNVVLYDANDNVVETFPANTLSYSGSKVTINPSSDLAYNTAYYLLIENEAFISNNEVKTTDVTDPTVISFTTESQPNTAPVASNVLFIGNLEANQLLIGAYAFTDADSDVQSGSTLQWFVADDASGANRTAISGATSSTFTLTSSEVGKFISYAVTPNDGTDAGTQTFASYAGPVVAAVVPTVISTIPTDGSVDVAKDANLSFTMSETVTKGTGNITLTPVTGTATVIDVTSNEVAISGADVTINPDSDLLEGQFYTVTFDASAFIDADGNNSAGLTSQTTWNFTVKEANVAPEAQGVSIKQSIVVTEMLEGSYTYFDQNDDTESGTTYQWYRADDATGTGRTAITGATAQNYTVVNDDNNKFFSFEVTPNDGSLAGAAEESTFFG
ncbi:MAG: hypothetical protein DCO95_18935, partial [Roseivirga sp. XM-24bin3]